MFRRKAYLLRRPVILIPLMMLLSRHAVSMSQGTLNRSQLQLFQNQYLAPSVTPGQRAGFSSLGADVQLKEDRKLWSFGFAGNGIASLNGTTENYFAVPDLYAVYRGTKKDLSFTIGRKREIWSEFDEQWKLGLWQPVAKWDYLSPQEQGLTGVFVNYQTDSVKLMMFASGLFIPDQGPNFRLKDGQFTSDNRWFEAPQSQALLREPFRINYALDRPSVTEIINQVSWGFKGTLGDTRDGYWFSLGTAIKPLNQLHLQIDPKLRIREEGVAVIHAMVVSHQVTAMEAGYRNDRERAWISVTRDAPNRPNLPRDWLQSSLYPALFIGAFYSHPADIFGLKRSQLSWSLLRRWDEKTSQSTGIAGDQVESSLQRFDFEQVGAIEWMVQPIDRLSRSFWVALKYMYSFPEKGGLLSTRFKWSFDRDMLVELGVDLLGADTEYTSGLMGRYRSNSRLIGGLSYAF